MKLENRDQFQSARELLYGQLPVPLDRYSEEQRRALLNGQNEFDEQIALLFRRVEWDDLEATRALQESKFNRGKGYWRLGGIDQPLDLKQLLSNLGTYAIHETQGAVRTDGKHTLLIPLRQSDFIQLVVLLYPHPAAEDAARALWRKFLDGQDIQDEDATHIAPSVAMIARLDLRHRQQGQMIGAIAGDMVGSPYEVYPITHKSFDIVVSAFTDDTVLTVAVAYVILGDGDFAASIKRFAQRHPRAGYGGYFQNWMWSWENKPYNRFGNGSGILQ